MIQTLLLRQFEINTERVNDAIDIIGDRKDPTLPNIEGFKPDFGPTDPLGSNKKVPGQSAMPDKTQDIWKSEK